MAEKRTRRRQRPLTVWRVPDDLWKRIAKRLPIEEFRPTGGRRGFTHGGFDGIVYVLRTGCQWKAVPLEYGRGRRSTGGSNAGWNSAASRRLAAAAAALRRRDRAPVALAVRRCVAHKAPLGGEKNRAQSHRSRQERHKRHHLTDGAGLPIAVALTAANRPDKEAIGTLLDARVVRAPSDVEVSVWTRATTTLMPSGRCAAAATSAYSATGRETPGLSARRAPLGRPTARPHSSTGAAPVHRREMKGVELPSPSWFQRLFRMRLSSA